MNKSNLRYALESGAIFGFAGLFFGLGLVPFFSQTFDSSLSVHTLFLPSIALFITATILWWIVVVKNKQTSMAAGIIVGIAVGLISFPAIYGLARFAHWMFSNPPSNVSDLHRIESDELLYSFWSLFSVGWISTTICGVIGALLARRQRPMIEADERLETLKEPTKGPEKQITKEIVPEEPSPRPFSEMPVLQLSLLCPFCKGSLSEGRVVRCSVCGTRHHSACWKEHGRCSVFSCPGKEESISFSKKQVYTAGGVAVAAVVIISTGFWLTRIDSKKSQESGITTSARKAPPMAPQQEMAPEDCEKGRTPEEKQQVHELLEAARFGQTARILSLIQSGANIDARGTVTIFQANDRCWTPLMVAAYYGSRNAVDTLIEASAGIDIPDTFGYTALMLAIVGNQPVMVRRLLKAHASVHLVSEFGDSPLSLAVIRGNTEIVQNFIRAGAQVNARNLLGYPPLIQAIRAKQFEVAKILLNAKADPNIADNNGKTPLSWATELANAELVNALLKAGAYPNVKDAAGVTPLMYATLVGEPDILRSLLRAGADVNAADVRGSTALTYARQNSRQDLITILQESGAKN